MIQMTFSFEEIEALARERFLHPHPFVRRKMEAVLLKTQHLPHQMICRLCGICGNTLRSYLDEYQAGGLDQLKELPLYRPESQLEGHREVVQTELALHPVATIKQARSRIFELTGLKRGLTQVRAWLGRCRVKRRKVGMIPAKADPEKQAAYRSETLEPRLREAQAGQRLVAVSLDEIVLEIPMHDERESTIHALRSICSESAKRLLHDAAPPVEVTLSESWPAIQPVVHAEIFMHNKVAKADDLRPWDVGIGFV